MALQPGSPINTSINLPAQSKNTSNGIISTQGASSNHIKETTWPMNENLPEKVI